MLHCSLTLLQRSSGHCFKRFLKGGCADCTVSVSLSLYVLDILPFLRLYWTYTCGVNNCRIAGNVGERVILVDSAMWKRTPNLYSPIFTFTYQARVSSSIVWRCRCFVTLEKLIAFLLSRTNFANSASPSIFTRVSSWNDGWLMYNRKSDKCRILRFRHLFPRKYFPLYGTGCARIHVHKS